MEYINHTANIKRNGPPFWTIFWEYIVNLVIGKWQSVWNLLWKYLVLMLKKHSVVTPLCKIGICFKRNWGKKNKDISRDTMKDKAHDSYPNPFSQASKCSVRAQSLKGTDLRLWHFWPIWTVQYPRKIWLATNKLLTAQQEMWSVGPRLQRPLVFHF